MLCPGQGHAQAHAHAHVPAYGIRHACPRAGETRERPSWTLDTTRQGRQYAHATTFSEGVEGVPCCHCGGAQSEVFLWVVMVWLLPEKEPPSQ